ncbi:MAG: carbohydrate binding family 9 domain-containing protein [Steroidobacteraceae bacterium]
MRTPIAPLLCVGLAVLGARHAHAAEDTPPSLAIGKTSGAVTLDGNLNTALWRRAPALTLTQQNPNPGQPTPFTTTVRLLRDSEHLYLGIRCDDPHPDRIAVHTLQRDGDQSSDDNVTVVLDTFGQRKLAYVFQVNAGGAMADGLISPGYTNGNTGSPIDYSWNGYWRAVVKRDSRGWTAEIAIDAQSLQFSARRSSWGLNVSRYVPREQLTLAWSGISLNATVTDLQREGTLTGVSGLVQGTGLEFDPYALARDQKPGGGFGSYTGFDVKYNVTPALAGLLTYRTDFSDAPTNLLNVTVSPYAQSVPETRAFFLDGANIFTFSHNLGQSFVPFYSQTVGLVNGAAVPVEEGTKLLGHAGAWTLGMLDLQMGDSAFSEATNLFAARAAYNLNNQWRIGTLVTHGDPTGRTDNTLVSFDTTWSTSDFAGDKDLNLAAWAAHSSGQLPTGNPDGYGFDIAYPNDLWWMDFSYADYGEALEPAMGFVQRPGTRQAFADVNWQPRPGPDSVFSWVRQFDIYATDTLVLNDLTGSVESEDWKLIPLQGTTQSGWYGWLEANPSYESLTSPYEIVPGVTLPAGDYHFTSYDLGLGTPRAHACWALLEAEGGGLYGGRYLGSYPALVCAAFEGRLHAQLQPALIWFRSPEGRGSVRAQSLSLVYSFSPELSLQTLLQYDNVTRSLSSNTMLSWIIQPDRILHLVWNHGLTLNPNLLQGEQTVTGTSIVVKLDWGFEY